MQCLELLKTMVQSFYEYVKSWFKFLKEIMSDNLRDIGDLECSLTQDPLITDEL